jgi:hypothetical protein
MKTRKLVAGYTGLALGGAVIGSVGNAAGAPAAGVVATGASALQLAGTGLYVGAAGGVLNDVRKLERKKWKL